jgi:hypothetical protein
VQANDDCDYCSGHFAWTFCGVVSGWKSSLFGGPKEPGMRYCQWDKLSADFNRSNLSKA